jgi:hypoxanthine phosphoribosyltransferase
MKVGKLPYDEESLLVLDLDDAKEIVEKYLVPQLDGNYDIVVGVLDAGKPIADMVAEKLELPIDYVKCKRVFHMNGEFVDVKGKSNYGNSPLFVDDVCNTGITAAAIKHVYPKSEYAAAVATLETFQPTSAVAPWVRYITPDQIKIGVVSDFSTMFSWEGTKFELQIPGMVLPEMKTGHRPESLSSFDFYPTEAYNKVTI